MSPRYKVMYINVGFRLFMDCLMGPRGEETKDGSHVTEFGTQYQCKVDCRGQIIISIGAGILVGALLVVGGRWVLRYYGDGKIF